jgi:hypothetical protein
MAASPANVPTQLLIPNSKTLEAIAVAMDIKARAPDGEEVEIGSVLSIVGYKKEDDAVRIADDMPDGQVYINYKSSDTDTPFGELQTVRKRSRGKGMGIAEIICGQSHHCIS